MFSLDGFQPFLETLGRYHVNSGREKNKKEQPAIGWSSDKVLFTKLELKSRRHSGASVGFEFRSKRPHDLPGA